MSAMRDGSERRAASVLQATLVQNAILLAILCRVATHLDGARHWVIVAVQQDLLARIVAFACLRCMGFLVIVSVLGMRPALGTVDVFPMARANVMWDFRGAPAIFALMDGMQGQMCLKDARSNAIGKPRAAREGAASLTGDVSV